MTALFNTLVGAVQTSFEANTVAGNPVLNGVSALGSWTADSPNTVDNPSLLADAGGTVSIGGLFIGLPVFGGSVPRGAVITSLAPLTLSAAPTANASQVLFTTGFLTTGRRLKLWSDVSAQPALFLRSVDEELEYVGTTTQMQALKAEIWIYSNAGQNPDAVPETALNNLLDALQSAFAPDDGRTNRFTLGGLVQWCRLEGRIMKDPGDTGGQAIAVAEVMITVP